MTDDQNDTQQNPVAVAIDVHSAEAGPTAGTYAHIGEVVLDVVNTTKQLGTAYVEGEELAPVALEGLFTLTLSVVLLVALETEPPESFSDPDTYIEVLRSACEQTGKPEVFMPLCGLDNHSFTGDAVFDAGYWHGSLFSDFWSAQGEASSHLSGQSEDLGRMGILHYRTDSPSMIEFIYVE